MTSPTTAYPLASRHEGVLVVECVSETPAYNAGIRTGDRILYIDETPIRDSIDLHFYAAEEEFEVRVRRGDEEFTAIVERPNGELLGLIPTDPPIRECSNFCPFCFVDQAPKDRKLRAGLEIRDDDYRYSFLYGHYVTLTNLTKRDKERIKAMRLSPLYVSVHATDPELRAKLLGRPKVPILPLIDELIADGIEIHAQLVLWPGVNDGEHLKRSVADLFERHPGVASVAAVPVGLTDHHDKGVKAWTRGGVESALFEIMSLGNEYPTGFLQAADEWYSMLDIDPPPIGYYGGMEVEENGVGLVRRMLDDWKKVKLPKKISSREMLILSGISPRRYITRITESLSKIDGMKIELRAIENKTFGKATTVTGLLAWSDIAPEVSGSKLDTIVIPDVMLDGFGRFLDGVDIKDAARESKKTIRPVDTSAAGFASLLAPSWPA